MTRRIVLALALVLVVVGSRSAVAEPLAQQPEVAAALQVMDAWVGDPAPAIGMLRPIPSTAPTWVSGFGDVPTVSPNAIRPASSPSKPSCPSESSHVSREMIAMLNESTPLVPPVPNR